MKQTLSWDAGQIDGERLSAQLHALLMEHYGSYGYTFAFARDGREIYTESAGTQFAPDTAANHQGLPNKAYCADAIFSVASVTKPVFATLLYLLQQEYPEFRVEQPVRTYLPEFQNDEIPFLHVLNHAAGFDGNAWQKALEADAAEGGAHRYDWDGTRKNFGKHIRYWIDKSADLDYEPGTKSSYTNDYILFYPAIARVSSGDMTLPPEEWQDAVEAFAREKLFDPLGMDNTSTLNDWLIEDSEGYDEEKAGRFFEYVLNTDAAHPDHTHLLHSWAADGSTQLLTTVNDMIRYGIMLDQAVNGEDNRILEKETIDAMLSRSGSGSEYDNRCNAFQVKYNNTESYFPSFGSVFTDDEVGTFGHAGSTNTCFFVDPVNHLVGASFVQYESAADGYRSLKYSFETACQNLTDAADGYRGTPSMPENFKAMSAIGGALLNAPFAQDTDFFAWDAPAGTAVDLTEANAKYGLEFDIYLDEDFAWDDNAVNNIWMVVSTGGTGYRNFVYDLRDYIDAAEPDANGFRHIRIEIPQGDYSKLPAEVPEEAGDSVYLEKYAEQIAAAGIDYEVDGKNHYYGLPDFTRVNRIGFRLLGKSEEAVTVRVANLGYTLLRDGQQGGTGDPEGPDDTEAPEDTKGSTDTGVGAGAAAAAIFLAGIGAAVCTAAVRRRRKG